MGLRNFLGLIKFTTMNFMSYHTEHVQRYQVLPLDELIPKIPLLSLYIFFSRDWIFRQRATYVKLSTQLVKLTQKKNEGIYVILVARGFE